MATNSLMTPALTTVGTPDRAKEINFGKGNKPLLNATNQPKKPLKKKKK